MARSPEERCPKCKQKVEWIFAPERGRTVAFDDTTERRGGDPRATWVTYPDPKIGVTRARKLAKGEHFDPDTEELVRPHWATCPEFSRSFGRDRDEADG